MKIIFISFLTLFVISCGGGSSSGSNPSAAAACNETPRLGSTTFGNGCFK